jgi:hypothetical protein
MKLYVYCLCAESPRAALASVVGVAGIRPRVLPCNEIVAVVSEFDGDAVAVTRAHVLAHERVVGRVLTETTPLPFRFGTLTSEARLQAYVAAHEAELRARLERVRGCVEMSVKVIWRAAPEQDETTGAQTAADAMQPVGAGTAFLEAKRRALAGDEATRACAQEIADWLAAQLAGVVRATYLSPQPEGAIVCAAAHLVERGRLEDYRARLKSAFAARPALRFLTSGPWPPYSFSAENP